MWRLRHTPVVTCGSHTADQAELGLMTRSTPPSLAPYCLFLCWWSRGAVIPRQGSRGSSEDTLEEVHGAKDTMPRNPGAKYKL